MSRMFASAIAVFAASVMVLASAVMLTYGPVKESASPTTPAVLDQIEPRLGANRGRISSDMTSTIRQLELRSETEGRSKSAATEVSGEGSAAAQPVPTPAPVAEKPVARNVAAPPRTASVIATEPAPQSAALPARGFVPPASSQEVTDRVDAARSGNGPINLMPRRSIAGATDTSRAAFAPSYAVPSYAAAVPTALAATSARPTGPMFVPLPADELNLTADQLNERELQRIRKEREAQAARTTATQ